MLTSKSHVFGAWLFSYWLYILVADDCVEHCLNNQKSYHNFGIVTFSLKIMNYDLDYKISELWSIFYRILSLSLYTWSVQINVNEI